MRIRTALLAVILAITVVAAPSAKSNQLDSIRPLQAMVTLEFHGTEIEMRRNICTAWATLYHGERVWATAGHCAYGRETAETWIDGKPARFLFSILNAEANVDIALYAGGPQGVQPFLLAATVDTMQAVWSAGYPQGSNTRYATQGIVSAKSDDEGLAVYNLAVAGGDSGSPIVDVKSGLVVGIVTQTLCNPRTATWCPMMRGTTLENLRRVFGEN